MTPKNRNRDRWWAKIGHLSLFSEGRRRWGAEIDMGRRIQSVFRPDVTVTHIYDFGSTSVTSIHAVGLREGKPTTKHPIALMARNEPPELNCEECGEPATHSCQQCAYHGSEAGWLCRKHAKKHEKQYEEHWVAEVFNSPRMGICGYTGPATPPY